MTKFLVESTDLMNEDEQLLKDKKLIILDEALKYCEKNDVDQIRYSELKKLCNNRLAELTNGYQTDFGGSFDKYIEYLESNEEPTERFLRREKSRPKKTFIILDVPKIVALLGKKGIKNSNYDESFLHSLGPLSMSDVLSTANVVKTDDKNGLVYIESKKEEFQLAKEKHRRDKITNALISHPWIIHIYSPKNENFRLDEESIQQLLLLGKGIASKDKGMPFKITLEYEGVHSTQKNPENMENMN
jgi:hypothetical protein